jgi:hypothetical protein
MQESTDDLLDPTEPKRLKSYGRLGRDLSILRAMEVSLLCAPKNGAKTRMLLYAN